MPNDLLNNMTINKKDNKYPYCVVFTYLPCASTFIPTVGHVGICTSTGIIHDFSGSYSVSVDNMEFGDPMKYWQLDKNKLPLSISDKSYDDAIYKTDEIFKKRRHNLFLNNCHHHVAMALNNIKYKGRSDWTPFKVFFNLMIHGHFVSWKYFFVLYGPFVCMVLLFIFIVTMI
ncbi:conserved protein, unknown function [Plasmodium reichenowi]|uniref:PPPDE domain-containing protein n=8 Tax=Plasmodium (Laverania) TaxID=418107 RepID=C0H4C5_PLAF7|nr:conserved protein, unknown function [Plasmodium falciparum 3D7]XP_019970714.1 conserved protein, unknown function [Plasmodium reichenowi]KAF4328486.1 hypothetical protein CYL21_3235 [Plasmodium falciparum NF54]SOS76982.1 conserved protein, unknown function [Plasmodium sp. gorilla clade G1]KYO01480.1 conserved protein, unknown function [Plasmodium reichenowi]PKC45934.1 hypothetical protein CK202_3622 [Plasmodium falciparum NF54]CAX63947.1 conserved protein, unknown function [Plasmodium falc|eukprot:XP_002808676.1 conserved protein, unknown function [Plasmodium falciparum 3D7]